MKRVLIILIATLGVTSFGEDKKAENERIMGLNKKTSDDLIGRFKSKAGLKYVEGEFEKINKNIGTIKFMNAVKAINLDKKIEEIDNKFGINKYDGNINMYPDGINGDSHNLIGKIEKEKSLNVAIGFGNSVGIKRFEETSEIEVFDEETEQIKKVKIVEGYKTESELDYDFKPAPNGVNQAGKPIKYYWYPTDSRAPKSNNATAVGKYNYAYGEGAFAVGIANDAGARGAFAGGSASSAYNENSFAFGRRAKAMGENSFALGEDVKAYADNSFAFGKGSKAHNINSIAFGNYAKSYGYSAVAIGRKSEANGHYSLAMSGGKTEKNAKYAVAIGAGSISEIENSLALGKDALSNRDKEAYAYNFETNNEFDENDLRNINLEKIDKEIEDKETKIGDLKKEWDDLIDWKFEKYPEYNELSKEIEKLFEKGDTDKAIEKEIPLYAFREQMMGEIIPGEIEKTKNEIKYLEGEKKLAINAFKSTHAAISIGNEKEGFTRQIIGLAAGTKDTDAVNLAQLKSAVNFVDNNIPIMYTDKNGNKVIKKSDDKFYKISEDGIVTKETELNDNILISLKDKKQIRNVENVLSLNQLEIAKKEKNDANKNLKIIEKELNEIKELKVEEDKKNKELSLEIDNVLKTLKGDEERQLARITEQLKENPNLEYMKEDVRVIKYGLEKIKQIQEGKREFDEELNEIQEQLKENPDNRELKYKEGTLTELIKIIKPLYKNEKNLEYANKKIEELENHKNELNNTIKENEKKLNNEEIKKNSILEDKDQIKNLADGSLDTHLDYVVTLGDIKKIVVSGINFAGNKGEIHKNIGEKISIVGGTEGLSKLGEFSTKNIITVAENDAISIRMSDKPTFKNVIISENQTYDSVRNNEVITKGYLEKALDNFKIKVKGTKKEEELGRGDTLVFKDDTDISVEKAPQKEIADTKEVTSESSQGNFVNNISKITGLTDPINEYDEVNKGYVDKIKSDMDKQVSGLKGGVAGAMAMANLVQANSFSDYRHQLSAAFGAYDGKQALAVGYSGITKNRKLVYKLSGSVDSLGKLGFGAGIGIMLGEKNEQTPNNYPQNLVKELEVLKKKNEKIQEENEKIKKENAEIKQMLKELLRK